MAHNIKQEDVIVIDDDDSMTGSAKDADADLKQEEVMHKGSSLLPVPQSQIPERVIFRPGCKVVCVDFQQGTAPQVSYGTVQSVLVDLSSMVYQFKINPATGATFTAREDTLQFGQGEAVWVNASDGDGYVEGLVLSSSMTPGEERLYTISRPSQPGIYDAIPAKHVKYRSPGSTKPANDADEGTLKSGSSISSNERLTNSNDASVNHSQNQGVSRSVVGAGSITTQEAAGRPKRALDESSASEEPRKAGKEEKEYGKPYSDKARSPRKQRREELAPRQLKKVIRIPPCVHYDHVNDGK